MCCAYDGGRERGNSWPVARPIGRRSVCQRCGRGGVERDAHRLAGRRVPRPKREGNEHTKKKKGKKSVPFFSATFQIPGDRPVRRNDHKLKY